MEKYKMNYLFFKSILNGISNWKTTLLGTLGLLMGIIENSDIILSGDKYEIIKALMPCFGVFLLGFFSKDADKTGVKN